MIDISSDELTEAREATPRMIAFLAELVEEREINPRYGGEEASARLRRDLKRHANPQDRYRMGFDRAKQSIKWMLDPTKARLKPGVVPSHIRAMPTKPVTPKPEARNQTPATRAVKRDPATLLTSGIFRLNGETFIIVPTKGGKHIAKRYVETPARLTSSGETVRFDWVSAPGVIWALEEQHRLPVGDIEAMIIEHKVCIYPGCYRVLKAAKSVKAGVGKVHAAKLGIPWGVKR